MGERVKFAGAEQDLSMRHLHIGTPICASRGYAMKKMFCSMKPCDQRLRGEF